MKRQSWHCEKPSWRSCLAAAALYAAVFGQAAAQQVLQPADLVAAPEQDAVRRYAVEVIVFEYNGDDAGTELFLPKEPPGATPGRDMITDDGVPYFSDGTAPIPGVRPGSVSLPADQLQTARIGDVDHKEEDRPSSPDELILKELPGSSTINLRVMEPHEYSLDDVYAKLDELGAYTPLLRTGWIQDAVGEDQARALRLRRLGDPPLRLDGKLTLYLGRYLHLVVDLTLEEMVQRPPMAAVADNELQGRSALDYDPYASDSFVPVRYRIEEDRIVRNGELRYFDHPKFGILAKVTRMETAQAPAEPTPIGGNVSGGAQRDF